MSEIANSPHWDLTNVYPALDSDEFNADLSRLQEQLTGIELIFDQRVDSLNKDSSVGELSRLVSELIDHFNITLTLAATLEAYIYSFVATDSYNDLAKKLLSQYELVEVRMKKLHLIRFRAFIGRVRDVLPMVLQQGGTASEHAFMLQETAEQSQYLMSEAEEVLAAELDLSGANAWGKLQGTITSQLSVDVELYGELQSLPSPALINLRTSHDEVVRKLGYETELKAWESIKEPLAASLNGIKGTVNTLNKQRGRIDALHSAIDAARIDRETLDVMLAAIEASFPMFRKYFAAKAQRFGQGSLSWWNLFAPVGKSTTRYTYDAARDFILNHFAEFSPELHDSAKTAFEKNWIDAEQRDGKRGGAFCMPIYGVKESRVLCNFDGSLDQVFTIAHELGHAFHNNCAYKAGKTILQSDTPMTLAETASIMCETIITEAVLRQVQNPEEELAILETSLISDSQVTVDIYSRFLFEREVFERRAESELSAEDFSEIMERAQKAAYGDGLDERYLHKYMWTWKPHYYSANLSFYNFPYAFGLLFGTGLYAIYQERGVDFIPDYMDLLASTGEGNAADLASRFDIDLRSSDFWEKSLQIIGKRIDRYTQL